MPILSTLSASRVFRETPSLANDSRRILSLLPKPCPMQRGRSSAAYMVLTLRPAGIRHISKLQRESMERENPESMLRSYFRFASLSARETQRIANDSRRTDLWPSPRSRSRLPARRPGSPPAGMRSTPNNAGQIALALAVESRIEFNTTRHCVLQETVLRVHCTIA